MSIMLDIHQIARDGGRVAHCNNGLVRFADACEVVVTLLGSANNHGAYDNARISKDHKDQIVILSAWAGGATGRPIEGLRRIEDPVENFFGMFWYEYVFEQAQTGDSLSLYRLHHVVDTYIKAYGYVIGQSIGSTPVTA